MNGKIPKITVKIASAINPIRSEISISLGGGIGNSNSFEIRDVSDNSKQYISKSIDRGEIINRSSYKMQKFKFDISQYSVKDIYRIWYSFFDPLLRSKHLNFLINNQKFIGETLKINNLESTDSKYYTFLNNNELQKVFDKIFLKC